VDGPIETIESDVSTVLAEVDKVLRVNGPTPWIAHVEVQASHDPLLPLRLLQYHALLLRRHLQPIVSTVVLLRSDADGADLSGYFEQRGPTGAVTVTLAYEVVRLWERSVDEVLAGGLGVLPLAPLAAVETDRVPEIIGRLRERFEREASPSETGELWAATMLLLGLRYDEHEARQILRGARGMRESSTYRAILEEGRVEGREEGHEEGRVDEARRFVLLGARKFGEPDARTAAVLEQIDDLDTLERLGDGLLVVSSWAELLRLTTER
jgi:predicted transposase YdaD